MADDAKRPIPVPFVEVACAKCNQPWTIRRDRLTVVFDPGRPDSEREGASLTYPVVLTSTGHTLAAALVCAPCTTEHGSNTGDVHG